MASCMLHWCGQQQSQPMQMAIQPAILLHAPATVPPTIAPRLGPEPPCCDSHQRPCGHTRSELLLPFACARVKPSDVQTG